MNYLFFLFLLLILHAPVHGQGSAPPYPERPNQQQIDEWRRLGEENLRKYGDGSTISAPTAIPFSPTPSLTPTLTPTPSPTPTPTPTPTVLQKVQFSIVKFFLDLFDGIK